MLKSGTSDDKPSTGKELEINLLDVVIVLAKYKKFIIVAPLIAAIIATIVTLQSPDIYTADTTFMPPKQAASVSSMISSLGSLGSIPGMLGGGGGVGAPGVNDVYVVFLKSRTMQDNMIRHFKLHNVYKTKSQEAARNALASQTTVSIGKDGLIRLQVQDTNPNRAAMLANGYVDVLLQNNNELAVSDASRRRLVAERELLKAKNDLSEAEANIKQLQEKTGLITVGSDIAVLQKMINTTERQLADMSLSVTPKNPDYIKLREKLNLLQAEIGKAQAGAGYISKAPERILDFTHKTRDMKYAEAIYQMALQQLTLAKVDEAKAGSSIQVIDRAVVPEQKSGPFRSRTIMFTAIAAFFVSVIMVFFLEAYQRVRHNAVSQAQFQTISRYLKTWN